MNARERTEEDIMSSPTTEELKVLSEAYLNGADPRFGNMKCIWLIKNLSTELDRLAKDYNTLCDEARWQGAELCQAKLDVDRLEKERDEAVVIAWDNIDDTKDPSLSLVQVVSKLANGKYWAEQRIAAECVKTCQAEKIPDVDIFSRNVNKAIQNCIAAISSKYGLDK